MSDSQMSNVNHSGLSAREDPYANNSQYNYKANDAKAYVQTNCANNFIGDNSQTYVYTSNQAGQASEYYHSEGAYYNALQVGNQLKYQDQQPIEYNNAQGVYEKSQQPYGNTNSEQTNNTLNAEYYAYSDGRLVNQYTANESGESTQVNSQNNYSKTDENNNNSENKESRHSSSSRRNRSNSRSSESRSRKRTHRSRSRSKRSRRRHKRHHRSRSRSRSRSGHRSRSHDRHARRRRHSSRHRSSRYRSSEKERHRSRHESRKRARNRSRSSERERRRKDLNPEVTYGGKSAGEVGVDVLEKARLLRSSEIEKRRQRDIEEAQRDDLTVLVFNMSLSVDERDIYELFSEHAGKVRDIQLVRDSRSGRSKGIAYVEFYTQESVIKALSMNGMSLKGQGIRVQSSQAEKNRAARAAKQLQENALKEADNPTTVMVSNLVGVLSNLSEGDLQQLFAPFGNVAEVAVARNDLGLSKGYAYVRFKRWTEAREALNVMNGFDISGQPIKVSYVTSNKRGRGSRLNELGDLDIERLDDEEAGLISGSSNKIALMKKLQQRVNAANIVLSNMYTSEDYADNNDFFDEIEDDVREECKKYGEVVKVYLNRRKPDGKVYVKFRSNTDAQTAHKSLQGRYFAGNTIQVGYLSDDQFNSLLGS
ncbi:RNA splicing factor [Theileria orientalis strain Shintoku]|uniref:RNA splicing factor n=1 Tax=Theileria orientalis strain Shintoku TaxID=869250 RepID=J4C8K0_THEOR|nr:RNA splicing factor [Theileria orientalis strain Shintoku]BAM40923.1 RNA splicing factor [Theileria orientalis strain Shintoku]|eukprot:XP_009691224.1 RNA splicing factor [Theileria orientalis strain Shintoku]